MNRIGIHGTMVSPKQGTVMAVAAGQLQVRVVYRTGEAVAGSQLFYSPIEVTVCFCRPSYFKTVNEAELDESRRRF